MIRKTAGRIYPALLALLLCFQLSGCRSRIVPEPEIRTDAGIPGRQGIPAAGRLSGESGPAGADDGDGISGETAGQGRETRENPEADKKEYDENAAVEIVPGSERVVHGEGEGAGAFTENEEAGRSASRLKDGAEETATRTAAAEEAAQTGVSEDAEEADSATTYYTTLLKDRLDTLYECRRLYVYWETAGDHVTVFRKSPEHDLILEAGAYDVSARLLEENLRVDDGWIGRKNPQVIVKAVPGTVLGGRVSSVYAAEEVFGRLMSRSGWGDTDAVKNSRVLLLSEELLEAPHLRTAAALILAKTAYPDLFGDTDPETALAMLAEEAAGTRPAGIYYYTGKREGNR